MSASPPWQAPTSGSPPLAAHVNQLLVSRPTTFLYQGVQRSVQATAGTGAATTNGLYLAQSFTTGVGQTATGYVMVQVLAPGNTPLGPTTLGLYASSGGAPTGPALVSTAVTLEYVVPAPLWVTFPLPAKGLTASTTYWLVLAAQGTASYSYTWNKSNRTSGASTSTNGTTWTAQTFGLLYQVFDQTVTGPITCTWSDGGQRWTWLGRDSANRVNALSEYTAGQTTAGYVQAYRTLDYAFSTNPDLGAIY